MFRKEVKSIGELILKNLRAQGLETPLQQKRLIAAWPEVMGEMIAGYTPMVPTLGTLSTLVAAAVMIIGGLCVWAVRKKQGRA